MNFLDSPIRIHDVNLTGHLHNQLSVLGVELLHVLEGHARVARLAPLRHVLVPEFWVFRKKDVQVRVPGMFVIKLIVRGVLGRGHVALTLKDRPEDPPRTQKGPFINDRLLRRYGSERLEDPHMQKIGPSGRVLVKFFERPIIYGLSTDLPSLFFEQIQLGCLARPDVPVNHNFHVKLKRPISLERLDRLGGLFLRRREYGAQTTHARTTQNTKPTGRQKHDYRRRTARVTVSH